MEKKKHFLPPPCSFLHMWRALHSCLASIFSKQYFPSISSARLDFLSLSLLPPLSSALNPNPNLKPTAKSYGLLIGSFDLERPHAVQGGSLIFLLQWHTTQLHPFHLYSSQSPSNWFHSQPLLSHPKSPQSAPKPHTKPWWLLALPAPTYTLTWRLTMSEEGTRICLPSCSLTAVLAPPQVWNVTSCNMILHFSCL